MSRVKDKLIRLQKEYASYGEYDGIYAKDVQEMIDDMFVNVWMPLPETYKEENY